MARLANDQRNINVGGLANAAEPKLLQSLQRGLEVLRAFTPDETSLSNSDLADRTGLSRSTVSRLTETLTNLGCLNFVPRTGRYQLGAAMVTLCHALLAGMPQRLAARPMLEELVNHARMPASLGMRDQLEMVSIETVWQPGMRPARFDLGSRLPLANSAMGQAAMYALAPQERGALFDRLADQLGTAGWDKQVRRIEAAFESIENRGFCASIGDRLKDLYVVGAPVVTVSGVVLAISCGGLPGETTVDRLLTDVGPKLADIARRIAEVPDLSASTTDLSVRG